MTTEFPRSVSVVIPVRDDARLLEVCLSALARQTRKADEIVIVDNGSSDDTAAVAERFGARVVSEPIRGIPRASAAGYDAATGDIIARLDADSRPGPDWIARIERTFRTRDDVDFVTGEPRFYGATPLVHWMGRTSTSAACTPRWVRFSGMRPSTDRTWRCAPPPGGC